MAGRPKRQPNDDLIDSLESERLKVGVSKARIAKLVDVRTSTITRSIASRSLSPDLAARIRRLLDDGISLRLERQSLASGVSDQKLRLLCKFVEMMPEVENALRGIIERPADGRGGDV